MAKSKSRSRSRGGAASAAEDVEATGRARRLVPFFMPGCDDVVNDALLSVERLQAPRSVNGAEVAAKKEEEKMEDEAAIGERKLEADVAGLQVAFPPNIATVPVPVPVSVANTINCTPRKNSALLTPAAIRRARRGEGSSSKAGSDAENEGEHANMRQAVVNDKPVVNKPVVNKPVVNDRPVINDKPSGLSRTMASRSMPVLLERGAQRKRTKEHMASPLKRSSPGSSPPRKQSARMVRGGGACPAPPQLASRFAGSTFEAASPAPVTLPIPEFASRKGVSGPAVSAPAAFLDPAVESALALESERARATATSHLRSVLRI